MVKRFIVVVDDVEESVFSDWSQARQRAIDLEENDGINPDIIMVVEESDGE